MCDNIDVDLINNIDKCSTKIKIKVMLLNGSQISFFVDPMWQIKNAIYIIQEKWFVPFESITLLLSGHKLNPLNTFYDYNICDDSLIFCIVKNKL